MSQKAKRTICVIGVLAVIFVAAALFSNNILNAVIN